jgi:hypothetical protein
MVPLVLTIFGKMHFLNFSKKTLVLKEITLKMSTKRTTDLKPKFYKYSELQYKTRSKWRYNSPRIHIQNTDARILSKTNQSRLHMIHLFNATNSKCISGRDLSILFNQIWSNRNLPSWGNSWLYTCLKTPESSIGKPVNTPCHK